MVGVNPPGNFLFDPQATDEQIGRYADLCSKDASCSMRTDDLATSMKRTGANMPERWLFLPIDESNVRIFSFYGLMESTQEEAPLSAPWTLDSWLSAAEGDASGFWFTSLLADLSPVPFVWGHYAAAARLDAQAAREYFSSGGQKRGSNLGYVGSAFAWGGGRMTEGWPAAPDDDAYNRVRISEVETLLIGGELDTSTPPQIAAEELLPYLPHATVGVFAIVTAVIGAALGANATILALDIFWDRSGRSRSQRGTYREPAPTSGAKPQLDGPVEDRPLTLNPWVG